MEDDIKKASVNLPDMNPEVVVYGPPPMDVANNADITDTSNESISSTYSESGDSEVVLSEEDKEIAEENSTDSELILDGKTDINENDEVLPTDNLPSDEYLVPKAGSEPQESFENADKNEESSDHLDNADVLKQINERIDSIYCSEQKISSEIREIHKLYHSEFAGRLLKMQDELDEYHKIDRGKVFDGILESLARIYCNSETLPDEVEDPKAKKNIKYMLMDIEDLCSEYGMTRYRSALGDKRSPKNCQIVERVPTNDHEKHDTVAKTYNSGFLIGNRVVMKERVDVYFYDEITESKETEKDNNLINE